jgi:hypothetical protein
VLWVAPLAVALLLLGYGFLTRPSETPGHPAPLAGQPLPDFTLPDLQGNPVQLSGLRGKVVFINIWATWCPPCVEAMPTMQRLYDRLHHRVSSLAKKWLWATFGDERTNSAYASREPPRDGAIHVLADRQTMSPTCN